MNTVHTGGGQVCYFFQPYFYLFEIIKAYIQLDLLEVLNGFTSSQEASSILTGWMLSLYWKTWKMVQTPGVNTAELMTYYIGKAINMAVSWLVSLLKCPQGRQNYREAFQMRDEKTSNKSDCYIEVADIPHWHNTLSCIRQTMLRSRHRFWCS